MDPGHTGLELDQDMPLQKREWMIQRIAWTLLAALLTAIALELLGNGPLSLVREKTRDGSFEIEYERFMRNGSPETIRAVVLPASGAASITVDNRYVRNIEIRRVAPEPVRVESSGESMTFVFPASAGKPVRFVIHFQPDKVGTATGWIAFDGGQRLPLRHVIYP